MKKKLSFATDKYRKARGGHSRMLLLSCEKCGQEIAVYQKDGPGMLKRLYLDRVILPEDLARKKNNLVCKKCKTVLGVPIIYKKEHRPAFRLFAGAVAKKIVKRDALSKIKL